MSVPSVKLTAVSSLYKPFADVFPDKPLTALSGLKGEVLSLQFVYTAEGIGDNASDVFLTVDCGLPYELYEVRQVPVMRPVYPQGDEFHARREPGMYPDPLTPLPANNRVRIQRGVSNAVWMIVNPEALESVAAGEYAVTATLKLGDLTAVSTVSIRILDAVLPRQSMMYTCWFHCDCICDAHGCEMFDDRHWTLLAEYIRMARRGGMNMILTPCFTPPLDTPVGGERRTAQLVRVTRKEGRYTFDFDLLLRWIDLCERCGIYHFEHSHLFSQWGALHAPKVMATTENGYEQIFGWDTDAQDENGEYASFLRQYLTELKKVLTKTGDWNRVWFHVSDEPSLDQLGAYVKAKSIIAPYIEGCHQFDALSHVEFAETGAVETPIPVTSTVDKFFGKAKHLWTYYTGGQCSGGLSNRLISMEGGRNRIIGLQMASKGIEGFLQWGYNFWYTRLSETVCDPWLSPDNDRYFVGGTSFMVYPGRNGHSGPAPTSRLFVFNEGLQDARAYALCAEKIGKEKTDAILAGYFGENFGFRSCPDNDTLLAAREALNAVIAASL